MRGLKSMELTAEESYDSMPVMASKPEYPYGLNGCITNAEIEKLGIDPKKIAVGDTFMVTSMVKITSVNCDEREEGERYRIEWQTEQMAFDGAEAAEEEAEAAPKRKSIYKSMASA